jgi:hypothetical protein
MVCIVPTGLAFGKDLKTFDALNYLVIIILRFSKLWSIRTKVIIPLNLLDELMVSKKIWNAWDQRQVVIASTSRADDPGFESFQSSLCRS